MISAALTVTKAHGAVIATSPARQPLTDMPRSGFPSHSQLSAVAERSAMNAAVFVVMKTCAIAFGSEAIVDPGLNPNQPSHSTKQPMTPDVMLCAGIGCASPFGPNLPRRGPSTRTPASAAQPPTLCTTVEPAKSHMPAVASQPPPQIQWPVTGYTKATSRNENTMKDRYLMRSATAPDTIVAAVPAKTSWKKNLA